MTADAEVIYAGHVPGRIANIASGALLSRWAYVLVTSLDSVTDFRDSLIADKMREQSIGVTFLSGAMLLTGSDLASSATNLNLFHGFDEVWCFKEEPGSAPPEDMTLVAPTVLEHTDVPDEWVSWMRTAGCELGLGDGTGLNYLTSREDVRGALEALRAES